MYLTNVESEENEKQTQESEEDERQTQETAEMNKENMYNKINLPGAETSTLKMEISEQDSPDGLANIILEDEKNPDGSIIIHAELLR